MSPMNLVNRTRMPRAERARHRAPARPVGARSLLLAALAATAMAGARADDTPAAATDADAFNRRAAICAAALEVDQLALVARARAGTPGLRPELLRITQLGFTYVGTAYLRGLRNPAGDQMLRAARIEAQSWGAARHAATVGECRTEAEALLKQASSLEQWFVLKRANARVDKFLAVPTVAAASNPASSASR